MFTYTQREEKRGAVEEAANVYQQAKDAAKAKEDHIKAINDEADGNQRAIDEVAHRKKVDSIQNGVTAARTADMMSSGLISSPLLLYGTHMAYRLNSMANVQTHHCAQCSMSQNR